MSAGTWRVVLADGSVRGVGVEPGALGWMVDRGPLYVTGSSAVSAVATAVNAMQWSAVEILAPGELSRAELTAQRDAAFRAGAEAMRAALIDAALTAYSAGDVDVVTALRECPLPEVFA